MLEGAFSSLKTLNPPVLLGLRGSFRGWDCRTPGPPSFTEPTLTLPTLPCFPLVFSLPRADRSSCSSISSAGISSPFRRFAILASNWAFLAASPCLASLSVRASNPYQQKFHYTSNFLMRLLSTEFSMELPFFVENLIKPSCLNK